jgi:hypothetical protein
MTCDARGILSVAESEPQKAPPGATVLRNSRLSTLISVVSEGAKVRARARSLGQMCRQYRAEPASGRDHSSYTPQSCAAITYRHF